MDLKALKYLTDQCGNGTMPALADLHIHEGRAQAGNGRYWVEADCDLPTCTVNAAKLAAAWAACKTTPEALVKDSTLTVKAGRVRARIALSDHGSYPRTTPDPRTHPAAGVTAQLARLQPYVATDASRPWATSVCIGGGWAYATNNVVLVRAPFPDLGVTVNLPLSVFDAVIAKGEPTGMGVSENSLTFWFPEDLWIKTNLISGQWPTAVVDGLVNSLGEDWETPHPDLGAMLATAAKLSDDRHPVVEFKDGGLGLVDGSFGADELVPVPDAGKVNARMAALVFERATAVKWHTPRQDVHAFRVGDITGVFGGQR